MMQPVLQLVRINSTELCLPLHAVSHEDILWVKMIEQHRRLGCEDYL